MSILALNPAQQAVFAEDVLDILKRRNLRFHGCQPWYLEVNTDGDMKMWFYGHRNAKPWAGGITIKNRADLQNAVIAGDCNMLAAAFEQLIDNTQTKYK